MDLRTGNLTRSVLPRRYGEGVGRLKFAQHTTKRDVTYSLEGVLFHHPPDAGALRLLCVEEISSSEGTPCIRWIRRRLRLGLDDRGDRVSNVNLG